MARAPTDPRRRYLPYADWPPIDRQLWETGLLPGDGLDDDAWAETCSPNTVAKAKQGYARWLGFLDWSCELDPLAHPADRPTRKRAAAYMRLLQLLENSPYTIVGRFNELRDGFKVIAPDRDMRWLCSPKGRSLRSYLRMKRQPKPIHDTRDLIAWGIRLMEGALALNGPTRRRVQFRDGLLICLLAARAPRLRSVCALQLGDHVVQEEGAWRIILGPEDMKTQRELAYGIPDELIPYLDRYLMAERKELLQGRRHDWFWVNWDGSRLEYRGIEKRIRWWSEKEFGKPFGTHTFRYAIGSTAPQVNPSEPGLAASVLGISARVLQESYNRAGQAAAAQRFQAMLRADRAATEGMARRAFEDAETGRNAAAE